MNKSIILIVFLITYSICDDDCTSLSTETSCTAKSGCKWTAGITCAGDDSCTSKTASESECTETKYTPKIKCTYTAALAATCSGNTACTQVTSLETAAACEGTKYGGTVCTYDSETPACSGGSECSSVTGSDLNTATKCESTYSGQTACEYKAGTPATCTGGTGSECTLTSSDLTTSTKCEATTYNGAQTSCVYSIGTCAAESGDNSNGNPKDNNSRFINVSLLFSFLYLLF